MITLALVAFTTAVVIAAMAMTVGATMARYLDGDLGARVTATVVVPALLVSSAAIPVAARIFAVA